MAIEVQAAPAEARQHQTHLTKMALSMASASKPALGEAPELELGEPGRESVKGVGDSHKAFALVVSADSRGNSDKDGLEETHVQDGSGKEPAAADRSGWDTEDSRQDSVFVWLWDSGKEDVGKGPALDDFLGLALGLGKEPVLHPWALGKESLG
eukprot:TRINITY_DN1976_c0_g1_i2.p3 TRINITY_DN1976_c0_g1~~TRINITY_DN1976_c0_g1_i2.p3  ORF type:complete len:154 (+),score=31.47 TRINITY_DN1976_c0_g1_i2:192-653(+)